MANAYINIYKDNPTEGEEDGTIVSTEGVYTAPISFVLDASKNESQTILLAIRTEPGYVATNVVIEDQNDTNDRLKFCLTENGTFSDSISIASVYDYNTTFYARATSSSLESPQVDRSASIKVACKIALLE